MSSSASSCLLLLHHSNLKPKNNPAFDQFLLQFLAADLAPPQLPVRRDRRKCKLVKNSSPDPFVQLLT